MILSALWPIFALILIGFFLRRAEFPSAAFWPGAESFNYFILFPALLVGSLSTAPLADPQILKLGAAIFVVIGIAFAMLWILRGWRRWPAERFGPFVQGMLRFNTYLGLAIVTSLTGPDGVERAAVLLAIAVPTVNVLSVVALTFGDGVRLRDLAASLMRNPLILACLAGILVSLASKGQGLPFGLDKLVSLLAAASLPLGLLCVGAALKPQAAREQSVPLLINGAGRLLLMPALAAAIGWLFALPFAEAAVLVVFSAIPTAPTAYVLTVQLKGDAPLMAGIVTGQTLLAALSLPVVLALLH